jgi:metal-responsive CopG/Arc/MetJ family transcriptional regulator
MALPAKKIKVTLSLDSHLVTAIDAWIQQIDAKSRSALVESILREWYQTQKQRKLEQDTEAYYLALSDEEREENQQWTQLTANQMVHLWD